jgi:UDP-N-acetylmuramyl pentapeptide phosphotransferase/UDP-N-acetylglucosamine-1-phosphate transferase
MIYLIIAVLLFISLLGYFKIADRFNIIDKPNQRSSHTSITIRGGGVVFPIAAILSGILPEILPGIFLATNEMDWILIAGVVAISIVSFWDDVSSLPNKVRILVHLFSVTALLYASMVFSIWPWWAILLAYVLIIGTINAYNFMDGINGITGVYSLAVLGSAWLYYQTAHLDEPIPMLIIPSIIACVVFLFFNFRKKAKCFAGDVGSVSIGFIVLSILLGIILHSGELKFIFFLAIYGVDAVLTIVHRLMLKQNIFEAHRLHFYQILANERKVSHLVVSAVYGITQLIVNLLIIYTDYNFVITGLIVCVPLAIVYALAKPRLMKIA